MHKVNIYQYLYWNDITKLSPAQATKRSLAINLRRGNGNARSIKITKFTYINDYIYIHIYTKSLVVDLGRNSSTRNDFFGFHLAGKENTKQNTFSRNLIRS